MSPKLSKRHVPLYVMLAALACTAVLADSNHRASAQQPVILSHVTTASIVQYVRDRYEVPGNVRVDVQPLRQSPFSHLYETAITTDDGKQTRVNDVFITTDALCFVAGNVFLC